MKWEHVPGEEDLTECWFAVFSDRERADIPFALEIYIGRMESDNSKFDLSISDNGKALRELSGYETREDAIKAALVHAANLAQAMANRLKALAREVGT